MPNEPTVSLSARGVRGDDSSPAHHRPPLAPALEMLAYLSVMAASSAMFAVHWLSPVDAAHLTLLWLVSLILLAWMRFGEGRHPAFLFLCLLTLFQGGRLVATGRDAETEIFRVSLMTSSPFDIPRDAAGTVLAAIAVSALALYGICRWNHHPSPPLAIAGFRRFLPYFYALFSLSLPVQLYKNYCYYVYARDHGGYLVVFLDHAGLAASIPLAVRAVSLVSLPALVGVLILETRRAMLWFVSVAYFTVAAPVLITGSRGAIFSLILSLWYLARAKSARPVRPYALALVAAVLLVVGALVGSLRIENGESRPFAGPAEFVADQGMSLNVTEVAVVERAHFAPHIGSYLANELESAFVAADQAHYVPGQRFSDDMAMFLNPMTYQLGFGSGSAFVAEAYVMGGLPGVALISVALGALLHGMDLASRHPVGLFLVVMVLPDVLWMARGGLVDWVSASVRTCLSLLLLAAGWFLYRTLARIAHVLAQVADAHCGGTGQAQVKIDRHLPCLTVAGRNP